VNCRLGVRIHREQAPESVLPYAREVERLGFDDVWVVEDLSFAGGLTAAAAVLSATDRITVGIGILAAVVRNPVYLAMEIATLERMFPGRTVVGVGHGVQSWMSAVGARVASPLTALDETLSSVGELLRGRRVSTDGRYARLRDVALAFPPAKPPPVLAGVRGPKSLSVAGARCDGVLLAEPATPAYLAWARAQAGAAAAEARRPRPEMAVYTWLSTERDSGRARTRLRPVLEENLRDPGTRVQLTGLPFAAELTGRLDDPAGQGPGGRLLEPEWVGQLAVAGTASESAAALRALDDAGADRIILLPLPGDEEAQIERFARDVRPLLL
jgi:5,10-methylenetetrahydromethanopterin reductase